MDEIKKFVRISKVARELRVGISVMVEFLGSTGFIIDPNPNSKITLEQYELIINHFKNISGILEPSQDFQSTKVKIAESETTEIKIESYNEPSLSNKNNSELIAGQSWRVGQVKKFNKERGFGFIECWEENKEFFIHITNVRTKPISENDFVVFKLGPSIVNRGSIVALDLYLISQFNLDIEFILKKYIKFNKANFRIAILKRLPIKNVMDLLKKELTEYSKIVNEQDYLKLTDAIKPFRSIFELPELRDKITKISASWINQLANSEYKIRLWLDEIIDIAPDEGTIKSYFLKSQEKQRLLIFKRLTSSAKIILMHQSITEIEPERLLDFIVSHLSNINGLWHYSEIKPKLYTENYWIDKSDYNIFIETVTYLKANISDKQLFRLFFCDYLDTIPIEEIVANCSELTNNELEKVLENRLCSKTDAFRIVQARVEIEISSFNDDKNIPDEDAVNEAEKDWDIYCERRAEPFCWIIHVAKKQLSESKFIKIENVVIKKTPLWVHLILWEKGLTTLNPDISDIFLTDINIHKKVENWISNNLITKEQIIEVLIRNLKRLDEISNRQQFYKLFNHLQELTKLEVNVFSIEEPVIKSNICFFRLANWIEDISMDFDFDEFKTKMPFLNSEHQITFLKKIFNLAHTKKFDLTIEKLNQLTRIDFDIFILSEKHHPEIPIDISVDIVIEAIKSFDQTEKFLLDSELLKIVLKDVTVNKKHKFQLVELFEKCNGQMEAKFNWSRNGEIKKIFYGDNKFYFAIQFEPPKTREIKTNYGSYEKMIPSENFEQLKEKIKQLPGRKWNKEKLHWGVPSAYEVEVMTFARENQFFLNLEGNKYIHNRHLAEFKRTGVPTGIKYCEGRLSNKKDKIFQREFWWCCNQPCYSNCETSHSPENWMAYTLFDFLSILGYNLDDGNRMGDYIEKGKYYQFISTINRFNRLLERLYCEGCGHILYPVEDSNYSHYRVTHFNCENDRCTEIKKDIYLHHCLNGKCNGIIDSRKSKKCPNGLFICNNEECGCCCSHEMLSRRLQNLETTGGYIHQNLKTSVANLSGHLERAEHFCFKCGGEMIETSEEKFQCYVCQIEYNVSKNNFKRPHKHLTKNQQSLTTNRGITDYYDDGPPF